MINYLETLLDNKTQNSCERILYTQWNLSKTEIKKKLQLIGFTFPNYTAHNASHSDSILNCLGNLFGKESFNDFSPEDIWLLLSAAYYHDCGMITSADEIETILRNDAFISFVKKMIKDPIYGNKKTSDFLQIVENEEIIKDEKKLVKKLAFRDPEITMEKFDVFRNLITEYIRKNHADRSKNFVENNDFLNSSKNFLVDRLIEFLGKACKGHMEEFKNIMKISPSEVGLGVHHFHPRFIACLIRLGDVLDMGNLRIATEQRLLSSICTNISKSHQELQNSINTYQLSPNGVRILFETNNINVAKTAKDLMMLINNEFKNQSLNWTNVKPKEYKDFPFIPTIEEVSVKLNDWDTFDERENNNVIIKSDRALELLRGANIYSDEYQSIRELIQNAIDATFINIFKNKIDRENKKFEFGYAKLFDKEQIEIDIKTLESVDYFTVTVTDHGYGMDLEDIKILTEIGSSKTNENRNKIIEEMPEWLKPSGTFGIGFQSIYLLTDKVNIYTRRANFGKLYNLEIYSPHSHQKGSYLIREVTSDKDPVNACKGIGTSVEFQVKLSDFKRYTYSISEKNTEKSFRDYDPVYEKSPQYQVGKIIDAAIEASRYSPIQTKIFLNGKKIHSSRYNNPYSIFCPKTNIAISFSRSGFPQNPPILYRNQPVKNHGIEFSIINFIANIHLSNAGEFLELSRNKIIDEKNFELQKKIAYSVFYAIKEKWDNFNEEGKYFSSLFVHHYIEVQCNHDSEQTKDLVFINEKVNIQNYWKTVKWIPISGKKTSVQKVKKISLEQEIKLLKSKYDSVTFKFTNQKEDPQIGNKNKSITISVDMQEARYHSIMLEFFKEFPHPSFSSTEFQQSLTLSKNEMTPLIPDSSTYSFLKDIYMNINQTRNIIPCDNEFKDLLVDESKFGPFKYNANPFPSYIKIPGYMICPIKIKYNENSYGVKQLVWDEKKTELIEKIKEYNINPDITKKKIESAMAKFKKKYKGAVDSINKELASKKNPYAINPLINI